MQRAVRSALAQTLREIEVVVVIDGEDSGTRLAMERVARQDPRLRVLALPNSVGGSDARNRGVDTAVGEWIAFLDDDDEWFPGKLQAQLDAVASSTASILIGTCRMIARTPGRDYVWPRRMPASDEQIGEYILARRTLTRGEGYIQTSTLFVRRSLMLAEPFKSGQLKHQDTEWVLRRGPPAWRKGGVCRRGAGDSQHRRGPAYCQQQSQLAILARMVAARPALVHAARIIRLRLVPDRR